MNSFKHNFKKIVFINAWAFIQFAAPSLFGAAAADTNAHMASQLSESSPEQFSPQQKTGNGLIIILDYPIPHNIPAGASVLLKATTEKASPILVSTSLIALLYIQYKWMKLSQGKAYLDALKAFPPDKHTERNIRELRHLTYIECNAPFAHEWIIKEVNPSLCLLFHTSYLETKKIPIDAIKEYQIEGPLTATEMQLGLKVNHMKTVTIADIKSPITNRELAPYFTEALEKNSLFVTNAEYASSKFSSLRSAWSIFMVGHGLTDHSVAGISLDAFKNFLSFLENKITTRLLYYLSCFGAGKNSSSLYHNPATGIDKTYNFAIINQSLPDTFVTVDVNTMNFTHFLHQATTSACIDYRALTNCLNLPGLTATPRKDRIPQIKLPGLEWFSVIDESKVASIGSLLAATRMKALNIGTFFQKNGAPAHPLALLLYASNILCELKIDVSSPNGYPPLIVSMIPGDAFHVIRKISSQIHPIEQIEESFFPPLEAGAHKTFVIGEIEAPFSTYMHKPLPYSYNPERGRDAIDSKKWVVISNSKVEENVPLSFFLYEGILYSIKLDHTDPPAVPLVPGTPEYNRYWLTIQAAVRQQPPLSEWAQQLFSQPVVCKWPVVLKSFHDVITTLFEMMEDKTELHLPALQLKDLTGILHTIPTTVLLDNRIASPIFKRVGRTHKGKSIRFDKLFIGDKERATNLILRFAEDGSYGELLAFDTEERKHVLIKKPCSISSLRGSQESPTCPEAKSPATEPTIEKQSISKQVTPETMKALAATLNNKENRESWLQKFSDALKSDAEWIKEAGRWIKKIYP